MPIFAGPFGGPVISGSNKFTSQLIQLLPPGVIWNLEQDSNVRRTLMGIADELVRIDARAANLVEETDPRTASETLGEWEAMLSLPDEIVTAIPGTLPERRVAVTQKLVSRAGQNYAFFESLCAACGYPLISISVATMLRVGFRVGDRVYGSDFAYSMLVTVSPAGAGALTHAQFEGVVRHATHSHITVMFTYT